LREDSKTSSGKKFYEYNKELLEHSKLLTDRS